MPDILKSQLIKLGSTNPELRPHIREILAKTDLQKDFDDLMKEARRLLDGGDASMERLPVSEGSDYIEGGISYFMPQWMGMGTRRTLKIKLTQNEVSLTLLTRWGKDHKTYPYQRGRFLRILEDFASKSYLLS